jgi:hypothetical protein
MDTSLQEIRFKALICGFVHKLKRSRSEAKVFCVPLTVLRASEMSSNYSGLDWRYDIPVVGLGTSYFYILHSVALACILCSLVSAVSVIVASFRTKSTRTFFKSWSKCERFVVYLALCDGLFNVAHFMDHFHMAIKQDHVRPLELCEFYGFIIIMFISAQMLLVSIIAINAFALMRFSKNIDLGKYDWKLLLLTFGFPFLQCLGVTCAGEMGPTGA